MYNNKNIVSKNKIYLEDLQVLRLNMMYKCTKYIFINLYIALIFYLSQIKLTYMHKKIPKIAENQMF